MTKHWIWHTSNGTLVHPFAMYAARHGWGLLVRRDADGFVRARVVVNDKKYVRIYGESSCVGAYASGYDALLTAYLETNGYTKIGGWSGHMVDLIPTDDGMLGVYIDGNDGYVVDNGDGTGTIRTYGDGADYSLHNTNGIAEKLRYDTRESDEDDNSIEDWNGNWIDVDDACEMRRYFSPSQGCGIEGWAEIDDVVYCAHNDRYILSDDAVRLANGEYALADDCVEIGGDYYLSDDDDVVTLENGDAALVEDCVEIGLEWYLAEDCTALYDDTWARPGDTVVELHDGSYALEDDSEVVELYDGRFALKSDCVETYRLESE